MESNQKSNPENNGLMASAEAIRKSGRVLYAFSSFYLPLYGLEIDFMFGRYDVFGYLSAVIYEIDEHVEAGSSPQSASGQLDKLAASLADKILIDTQVASLFEDAKEYYRFEHEVLRGHRYDLSDVMATAERRSFDFRLMHRALAQLTPGRYDEQLFAWLRKFEIRMEVEDDILSFDEDMRRGTFNAACLAVKVAGDSANQVVEEYRQVLERGIEAGLSELGAIQQERCRLVLSRYRGIVPRPETPRPPHFRPEHL